MSISYARLCLKYGHDMEEAMKVDMRSDQVVRILQIYSKLLEGRIVNKAEEATHYNVNERSIQRDFDSLRNFLDDD